MAQISQINFDTKRVTLHPDTTSLGFDIYEAYNEIRQLYAINANNEQHYPFFIEKRGYVPKGGGTYTPKYGFLKSGWRLMPYGGVSHTLKINTEIVSEDEISDADVFDRSGLAVTVDIDVDYQQVEIIQVSTGSGLSTEQDQKLSDLLTKINAQELLIEELWTLAGLNSNSPLRVNQTSRTAGGIIQSIGGDDSETVITRQ